MDHRRTLGNKQVALSTDEAFGDIEENLLTLLSMLMGWCR